MRKPLKWLGCPTPIPGMNPIYAGIAQTPESSDFTSGQDRIRATISKSQLRAMRQHFQEKQEQTKRTNFEGIRPFLSLFPKKRPTRLSQESAFLFRQGDPTHVLFQLHRFVKKARAPVFYPSQKSIQRLGPTHKDIGHIFFKSVHLNHVFDGRPACSAIFTSHIVPVCIKSCINRIKAAKILGNSPDNLGTTFAQSQFINKQTIGNKNTLIQLFLVPAFYGIDCPATECDFFSASNGVPHFAVFVAGDQKF